MAQGRASTLPALVAHADWSVAPAKRWIALALREDGGRYRLGAPGPVGDPATLLERLSARAGDQGSVLVGFDFPIGLPRAYGRAAGVPDFLELLPRLGRDRWDRFFQVAERPEEIALERPFYPRRPGAKGAVSRRQLVAGLGLGRSDQLYRVCDRATETRPAAAPLFWTLGAQQVGKAAISGWTEILQPALRPDSSVAIWPFHGDLSGLLGRAGVVIAETYPGEFDRHLGLSGAAAGPGSGKRSQDGRAVKGQRLRDWARQAGLRLDPGLVTLLEEGFGPHPGGEDPYDATVGLFGLLNVCLGGRPAGPPEFPWIRKLEGWILGQSAA